MIWRKPRHFACIIHSNSSPHPLLAASQPQPKRTSVNRDHFVSLFSCPALIREQPRANPCHRKWPWSMTLSAPVSTHYRSPLVPIIIALTFNARYPPPQSYFAFHSSPLVRESSSSKNSFSNYTPYNILRNARIYHSSSNDPTSTYLSLPSEDPPSRFLKIPSVIGRVTVSDNGTPSSSTFSNYSAYILSNVEANDFSKFNRFRFIKFPITRKVL